MLESPGSQSSTTSFALDFAATQNTTSTGNIYNMSGLNLDDFRWKCQNSHGSRLRLGCDLGTGKLCREPTGSYMSMITVAGPYA